MFTVESQQYSEKVFVMARGFVKHALLKPVEALTDVLAWLYLPNTTAQEASLHCDLTQKVIRRGISLIEASLARSDRERLLDGAGQSTDSTKTFLKPLSQGAIIMLQRHIGALEGILAGIWRER